MQCRLMEVVSAFSLWFNKWKLNSKLTTCISDSKKNSVPQIKLKVFSAEKIANLGWVQDWLIN